MIFFFGSSRSWAAREARRKARLLAKKRRRSIIQATVVVFSLMIFSISMWSLRKMRLSALSIRHTTHRNNGTHGLGRVLGGTRKTAVSAVHAEVEMPKPPLEPEAPVSKMDNSSHGTGIRKEGSQESGGAVKSQVKVSTESRTEAGSTSQKRSTGDILSKESSGKQETSHRGYRTTKGDREPNANPAVRGMTQEDTTSRHHDTNRVYHDRTASTDNGNTHEEVGKMGEIDLLDSEEGGEGLVITMPKKKSARIGMRYRKEEIVQESENSLAARRDHVEGGSRRETGERSLVDGNERVSMRDNYQGENRGNVGYAKGMEKPSERIPAREHSYTKRESAKRAHGSQGFGRVYREVKNDGKEYSEMMHTSLRKDSGEHRVATSNVDVTKNSRFRNGVSANVV